jgi:hypothetical protein
MARKEREYVDFQVVVNRYADDDMRERFEQSTPLVSDYANMQAEYIYSGGSEAKARAAFFAAAHRARHDVMVRNIVVWRNGEVYSRTKPV